ncbi:MAG: hypothetical protein ABSA79_11575 [Candidatus Bathyarchaeia archaeon]
MGLERNYYSDGQNCKKIKEMDSSKMFAHQHWALKLRCMRLPIPQIAAQPTDEGYNTSQHTVWKDFHSKIAQDYSEELLRKPLADKTNYPDIKTRLKSEARFEVEQ